MKKSVVAGLLVAAFTAGCLASQSLVAPLHAESPGLRWEYMCVDGWAGVTHSANKLGRARWEMAAAAGTSEHMIWCFKRPLP